MLWRGTFHYTFTDIEAACIPDADFFPVLPSKGEERALATAVECFVNGVEPPSDDR